MTKLNLTVPFLWILHRGEYPLWILAGLAACDLVVVGVLTFALGYFLW